MSPIATPDFDDSFADQPSRPPLAEDLQRAQRHRRTALVRRGWIAGLATVAAATVAVVALGAPAATKTAVPAAPPPTSSALAPAPTEEPTSDWPTRQQIVDQERVDNALEPMWKLVKGEGGNDPHYAAAEVSIEDVTATVYWKGEVPKVLRDLEGTTASGVKVMVVPAAYSQRDASRAGRLLFAASRRGDLPGLRGTGLSNTGNALLVGFSRADRDRVGDQELIRRVRAITDMRFRLDEGHDFRIPMSSSYAPVSDSAIAALASQGTELTVVATDRPSDLAVQAAGGSSDKRPVGVSLARATVRNLAKVSSTDPDGTGARLIEDRLVWVVVFPEQRQAVSHPAPPPGQSSPSVLFQTVSLAVLVDADTNAFLYGQTFG